MPALPTRPAPLVWALVLAVHVLALLGLQSISPSSTREATSGLRLPRIELRLLPPTDREELIAPTPAAAPAPPRARQPARPVAAGTPTADRPVATDHLSVPPAASEETAVQGTAESLLNSEATRRALRSSATGTTAPAQLAVEAGSSLRAPGAGARLSGEVQRAGTGDCAKGQYAGAGMGLLSLPFLAAAAWRGDCAK